MKQCKHCGSRYPELKGRGEFCCAGCEYVYGLIREGGLGDYYAWQDRVGRPLGERPFTDINHVSINQLQAQAENISDCKIVLGVRGMSCLGCAWLIEQLAARQSGVLFAKVALESNRLSLAWKQGDFDLGAFAEDLHKFGYRISGDVASAGYRVSPLAMRLMLTLIFSVNGLLLSMASDLRIGGAALEQLYHLLILICLLFTLFIGGTLFLKPTWGALRLGRFHSDAAPALLLLALFALALSSQFLLAPSTASALLYFILLPVVVFARWLSETRALKIPSA